jgi:hypothetical protein
MGSFKGNLFPFNDPENKKCASIILKNITNWINKLEDKNEATNEEIDNFTTILKNQQQILQELYKVDTYGNIFEQSETKNFLQDAKNIYFKKNYNTLFRGNPWSRKATQDENYFLLEFFRYISFAADYIRGIPNSIEKFKKGENPETNLRYFSNVYNLLSTIAFIVLIFFILKLVYSLIR